MQDTEGPVGTLILSLALVVLKKKVTPNNQEIFLMKEGTPLQLSQGCEEDSVHEGAPEHQAQARRFPSCTRPSWPARPALQALPGTSWPPTLGIWKLPGSDSAAQTLRGGSSGSGHSPLALFGQRLCCVPDPGGGLSYCYHAPGEVNILILGYTPGN